MTRIARLAHRTGPVAERVPARAVVADLSVVPARAGRPAASTLPATLERDSRQVGLDRSIQLARTPSPPLRWSRDGALATLAICGTGTRHPARTGSVPSLRVKADRHLDRTWDRANLTGARV